MTDMFSMTASGLDHFLDLLLHAAAQMNLDEHQIELMDDLTEYRYRLRKNSQGTFSVDELPWQYGLMTTDIHFMQELTRNAKYLYSHTQTDKNTDSWFAWLEDSLNKLAYFHKKEGPHYFRVISDQVRFGCGYRRYLCRKQYYAWHGYPSRNDDYITYAEITQEEFERIVREYPRQISADRDTAERFRQEYIDGHVVLKEGWNISLK
ncbi:MAG: hypothetical protein IKE36_06675 [Solobacterium sp.]|nr:hypothetical protein [Solobacterium sp.]